VRLASPIFTRRDATGAAHGKEDLVELVGQQGRDDAVPILGDEGALGLHFCAQGAANLDIKAGQLAIRGEVVERWVCPFGSDAQGRGFVRHDRSGRQGGDHGGQEQGT